MIVVLGRPRLAPIADDDRTETAGGDSTQAAEGTRLADEAKLVGPAAGIALAARGAGGVVELVGSIPDDDGGDGVVLALGRAKIGHAALLRDPSADSAGGRAARLDAADVALGLSYVTGCSVLVVAEPLAADALAVAADGATYHGAHLIAVLDATASEPAGPLPAQTTLLRAPTDEGAGPGDADDFAAAIGRYAAELDRGTPPADAFRAALGGGWERVAE